MLVYSKPRQMMMPCFRSCNHSQSSSRSYSTWPSNLLK